MGILIREIVGWLLVVLGLVLIGFVLVMAVHRQVLEALALSLPGTIVFRAGMSMVRLTTAARIASQLSDSGDNGPRS